MPFTDDMSVLQGLQYIKDHLDGSLTFRWSCRMAICGSCGMMVERRAAACRASTFLRDLLPGPAAHRAAEPFPDRARPRRSTRPTSSKKLESVKPYIIPKSRARSAEGDVPADAARSSTQYYQYSQCINCLLCYAACPQYGLNAKFTGPAALALLHRYNADSRDGGESERMEVVNAEEGVWGCTLVGYCSEVCPKGVDPAHAVNQNKVNSAKDYFLRFLTPRGGD